jgi:hypothetical protein
MKKKKSNKTGRKPLAPGLKKIMIRFFLEAQKIEAAGGVNEFINKCKKLAK